MNRMAEHRPLIPVMDEYDVDDAHILDSVSQITDYQIGDNDASSSFFQCLKACCGGFIICASAPLGCCCGPVITVSEGNRAVVLKFGKFHKIQPPGTYVYNTCSEQYTVVPVSIQTMTIPKQSVISKDGISVTVDAVCFYRIADIKKAIFTVKDYSTAIKNLAQYTLEVVLGEYDLNILLVQRDQLSQRIKEIMQAQTHAWGINITNLEIRDISMSRDLIRIMAAKAEAMRVGEAKVISAEAELKAAAAYKMAAKELSSEPGSMQLRYLETLKEIAAEKNSTIIVPDVVSALMGGFGTKS